MKKVIISVLGNDRPGIIAAVSRLLYENDSNIENVSQTSLQSEFAGIFIATVPAAMALPTLEGKMTDILSPMGLQVHVKPMEPRHEAVNGLLGESFVITTPRSRPERPRGPRHRNHRRAPGQYHQLPGRIQRR